MVRNSEILTLVYLTTYFIETLCRDKHNVYNQVPWPSFASGGRLSDYPYLRSSKYRWDPSEKFTDCVVAITYNGKHIATGVALNSRLIIMTSASAFEQFSWGTQFCAMNYDENLKCHMVDGRWDKSQTLSVNYTLGNQLDRRNRFWVRFGTDKKHSPVHDLYVMNGLTYVKNGLPHVVNTFIQTQKNRALFFAHRFRPHSFTSKPTSWMIAGFGFVDEADVKHSKQLQVFKYESDVLEDCDEWIPREWGHFICINNVDKLIGIASGAGLFHEEKVVGIGAFEITKGKDSILVFTNTAKYRDDNFHYTSDKC